MRRATRRGVWMGLCLLAVAPAPAGVMLAYDVFEPEKGQEMVNLRVYLAPEAARLEAFSPMLRELAGEALDLPVLVYRADREVFWIVSNQDRSYFEVAKADVEGVRQSVEELANSMGAAEAAAGPGAGTSAQAEERHDPWAMSGFSRPGAQGAAGKTPEVTVRRRSETETVGDWTCRRYDGFADGEKAFELWTVDAKALDLAQEDFALLETMAASIQGVTAEQGAEFPQALKFHSVLWQDEAEGISGLPVKQVVYEEGQPVARIEARAIERQEFGKSVFAVPEGFKKSEDLLGNLVGMMLGIAMRQSMTGGQGMPGPGGGAMGGR